MGWSLKLKSLNLKDYNKTKRISNQLEDSLTGTKIEQSDYFMKNNPNLLQVSEVANPDADLTADSSKTNEEDNNMKI